MSTMLSPHFSLAEFTASATARRLDIANNPTLDHIEAMRQLCREVLELVRAQFGRPVHITSGYRSPALSRAVGSSARSQHCKGQAADFEVPGVSNLAVATWIRDHLRFDQLILENYVRGDPNSGWIHCSYRPDRARHSVLTYTRRKYLKGLVA